jgi:histidine triad (HIT) family protein
MTTRDCIFCKIPGGEVEAQVVYRDDRVYVIRDMNPLAPVHLLIIPNQHVASLAYVGPGQVPVMGQIFVVAEEMARREGVTLSGYRLVMNQGPDSGQQIEHAHMHLLGGRKLSVDLG